MKTKVLFAFTVCAALLSSPMQAALTLTFTGTMNVTTSGDFDRYDGSTWTYTFVSSNTEYQDVRGYAGVVSDSVTLTISGASNPDDNGTFSLVESNTTVFAVFPNVGNSFYGLLDTETVAGQFYLGETGPYVMNLFPNGPSVLASSPTAGSTVELADFDGIEVVSSAVSINLSKDNPINGTQYTYNATVSASVPEPATYAALAGVCALAWCAYRRRRS